VWFTPTAAGSLLPITASYGGDSNNPSGNATLDLEAAWRATTTVVSCLKSVVVGSPTVFTCTARVKGYLPTGTIAWGQTGGGSVSLSSTTCTLVAGECSVTMTGSTHGAVTVMASYGGDMKNLGSYRAVSLKIT